MTDTNLLPCPFCGGSVSFHSDDECDGCHYIHCQGCDAMFDLATTADPEDVSETIEELRDAIAISWNRRAQPALRQPVADEREVFEAWANRRGLSTGRYGGGMYVCDKTMWAEIAWIESRAALSAPAAGQDVSALVEALELASQAMKAAHDSLFTQCLSNPIKNAWGKPVNTTAVNELQNVARKVDKTLAAHKAGGGKS